MLQFLLEETKTLSLKGIFDKKKESLQSENFSKVESGNVKEKFFLFKYFSRPIIVS
jgi:hypothetical protein